MADVKLKPVRIQIPTSGTTLDVTISGFGDVQAVIGFVSIAGTNNTATADASLTAGFLDRQTTPNQVNTTMLSTDANATADAQKGYNETSFIRCITTTGATACQLSFNSWITDGVRFNIDTNPSAARYLTCYFVGGTDAANSFADAFNPSNLTTVQDITAPGFEPDLVFFFSGNTNSSAVTDAQMSLGVCHNDGAATQGCISFFDDNGADVTVVDTQLRNDRAIAQVSSGTEDYNTTISAFDSSGFSLQNSANASSDRFLYLALKFNNSPDISIDFIDGPTATGNYSSTAPAFQPDFMMLLMSDNTSANTVQGADGLAIYATDGTNGYTNVYHSTDAVDTSVCKSLVADSIHDLTGSNSDLHVGTFTSFDTNGFTLNFTTAPATARKWLCLTVGDAVSEGAGSPIPLINGSLTNGGLVNKGLIQ